MKNILLLLLLTFLHIHAQSIEVGVRPYYLLSTLEDSALKTRLSLCKNTVFQKSIFSISHRGAPLQFPEHTKASYEAGIKMGAGILECDVTFTKDKELVCRHSECDLHTTTNILLTPLAKKCTQDFIPFDAKSKTPASAECCTTDITLKEFHTLLGKMDAHNDKALTRQAYVNKTPDFRTNLYANDGGKLMSHQESIKLFKKNHLKMSPEIKGFKKASATILSKKKFIDKLIREYQSLGVKSDDIYIQSFHLDDLVYIISTYPSLKANLIYLQEEFDVGYSKDIQRLDRLKKQGITTIAPPLWALLSLDAKNNIVPSLYAKTLKKHNFKIITWSLERSKITNSEHGGWYYQTIHKAINKNADILKVLYVLDKEIGVVGVFSDWPATTTFYKNCIDETHEN